MSESICLVYQCHRCPAFVRRNVGLPPWSGGETCVPIDWAMVFGRMLCDVCGAEHRKWLDTKKEKENV